MLVIAIFFATTLGTLSYCSLLLLCDGVARDSGRTLPINLRHAIKGALTASSQFLVLVASSSFFISLMTGESHVCPGTLGHSYFDQVRGTGFSYYYLALPALYSVGFSYVASRAGDLKKLIRHSARTTMVIALCLGTLSLVAANILDTRTIFNDFVPCGTDTFIVD